VELPQVNGRWWQALGCSTDKPVRDVECPASSLALVCCFIDILEFDGSPGSFPGGLWGLQGAMSDDAAARFKAKFPDQIRVFKGIR
jgi:hypothetical protein